MVAPVIAGGISPLKVYPFVPVQEKFTHSLESLSINNPKSSPAHKAFGDAEICGFVGAPFNDTAVGIEAVASQEPKEAIT